MTEITTTTPHQTLDEFLSHCTSKYTVEVSGRLTFFNKKLRNGHLIKHVLNNWKQKWDELLDIELIEKSRGEILDESFDERQVKIDDQYFDGWDNCDCLSNEYQAYLSNKLVELCNKNIGHFHVLGYREKEDMTFKAKCVIVRAWVKSERLRIFAVAHVSRKGVSPYMYKLTSGHRSTKNETEESFHSDQLQKMRDEKGVKSQSEHILAIHD